MENWTLTWTRLTHIEEAEKLSAGIAGVYRLSYLDETGGKYYVFYVGQAEDIQERLLQHKSNSETNTGVKITISTKQCFFRYATITEKYVRDTIERLAYKYYEPSCNKVIPDGRDDVTGNLD